MASFDKKQLCVRNRYLSWYWSGRLNVKHEDLASLDTRGQLDAETGSGTGTGTSPGPGPGHFWSQ